jgi:putative oxidoreductase
MSSSSWLYRFNHNIALLILRVSLGLMMFIAHGFPKMTQFPAERFPDPFGLGGTTSLVLAIFAEAICSLLLILGLWTRLALIPLIVTMSTAAFIIHAADPFGKKEMALLYLIGYITLFFAGPGKYAVDQKIRRVA